MVALGLRLKSLREEKQLTQEEIAKEINVSRAAYSYYETGKKNPSIETLIKIAEFYKISVDYLICRY